MPYIPVYAEGVTIIEYSIWSDTSGVLSKDRGGVYMDSEVRLINIKSNRERGMERIIRLLWVIVVLLIILIAKDSIPTRVRANAPMAVDIQRIGGSTIVGKVIDVRIHD